MLTLLNGGSISSSVTAFTRLGAYIDVNFTEWRMADDDISRQQLTEHTLMLTLLNGGQRASIIPECSSSGAYIDVNFTEWRNRTGTLTTGWHGSIH